MAVIGYGRVSTVEQTLDLQRDALDAAGATCIYEDKASGKTADRPELVHCLKALRHGDILVVWRLDRLGRNLQDLIRIVNDLEARGVKFRSITEAIDTAGSAGKLVFHMFAALAEFERGLVRERTLAGLAAARVRGRKGGRPSVLNLKQQRAALALMKDREMSITEIARQFAVSRSTLYNLQAASTRQAQQCQTTAVDIPSVHRPVNSSRSVDAPTQFRGLPPLPAQYATCDLLVTYTTDGAVESLAFNATDDELDELNQNGVSYLFIPQGQLLPPSVATLYDIQAASKNLN